MAKLDKYNLLRSGEHVRDALIMLRDDLNVLHVDSLDVQDQRLVTLTMDNLFANIMTACEVVRNMKKEVRMP